jgi:hypothetical protein
VSPQDLAAHELVEEPVEQKQRTNIYTMMLILSFIAICVACVLLWMELQDYGPYPWWKTDGIAPATSQLNMPSGVPQWLANAWPVC